MVSDRSGEHAVASKRNPASARTTRSPRLNNLNNTLGITPEQQSPMPPFPPAHWVLRYSARGSATTTGFDQTTRRQKEKGLHTLISTRTIPGRRISRGTRAKKNNPQTAAVSEPETRNSRLTDDLEGFRIIQRELRRDKERRAQSPFIFLGDQQFHLFAVRFTRAHAVFLHLYIAQRPCLPDAGIYSRFVVSALVVSFFLRLSQSARVFFRRGHRLRRTSRSTQNSLR